MRPLRARMAAADPGTLFRAVTQSTAITRRDEGKAMAIAIESARASGQIDVL